MDSDVTDKTVADRLDSQIIQHARAALRGFRCRQSAVQKLKPIDVVGVTTHVALRPPLNETEKKRGTHSSLGASSLHALLDLLRLVVGEVAGPRGRQLLGHGVGVGGGYPVPGGRRCRRVGREGVKAAGGELAGGVGGRVVDVLRSGAGSRRRQRRVGMAASIPGVAR
ncbi:hypothetical protein C0Q70_07558 [Pomacea canaliculata]|uniref:Uncharacterized protein n=1 Tax=Pomacea canaliculata TaxID=400727 RepID=A0A2T7PFD9_POMCA|nr:hypothetical protein C0Q70_07558 [Pomacea canaliculata]